MKWKIVMVGKPALDYARQGAREYQNRLGRFTDVQLVPVKDGKPEKVIERMLKASEGCLRVSLDERGKLCDTQEFREIVDRWERESVRTVAFLVGGADGHDERLRAASDLVLALGKMTLQHELALVILLEQLYRIYTLKKNFPYHR